MMTTEEWNEKPAGTASIPPRVWLLPAPDTHPDIGYWVRVNTGSDIMKGAVEYAAVLPVDPENVARMLDGVTPGPWSVCIDDDGNPLSGRPSVQAPDHCDCAIVHWDGFVQKYWRSARGDKEIHANARFIAYAREALPALATRAAELERIGKDYRSWMIEERTRAKTAEAKLAASEALVERLREALLFLRANYDCADVVDAAIKGEKP